MRILQRRKRKIFRHLARITFVFFAGLIVAGIIALHQLDINSLKPEIAHLLETTTGLPISIEGEISWKLSLRPLIKVSDVRIKNEPWAKSRYAVQIPEMLVQFNLVSLLRNSPTIQSVRMVRPTVSIERNQKGELSLNVQRPAREIRIPEAMPRRGFPFDLDVGIGSIELDRPRVSFISPDSSESFTPNRVRTSLSRKHETMELTGQIVKDGFNYPFILSFLKYDEEKKIYPAS